MTLKARDKFPPVADKIDRDLYPEEKRRPQIYIFLSFDLVSSTEYKNTKKKEWPKVFAQFYDGIKKEMKTKFPEIKVWKHVGDEVLFYEALNSKVQLFATVPGAFDVLTSSLKHLDNSFPEIFKPLSIKGTIWCAPVVTRRGEELENLHMNEAPNIALTVVYENNNSLRDFIGPDIDTGFRISHHAGKGKLVISADFAYLLLETEAPANASKKSLLKNLRIVSYENLKGIWKDRYYPIIWYFKDWEKREEDFDYDERFRSKIINNIILKDTKPLKELRKIFRQLKLERDVRNLQGILKESEKESERKNKMVPVIEP